MLPWSDHGHPISLVNLQDRPWSTHSYRPSQSRSEGSKLSRIYESSQLGWCTPRGPCRILRTQVVQGLWSIGVLGSSGSPTGPSRLDLRDWIRPGWVYVSFRKSYWIFKIKSGQTKVIESLGKYFWNCKIGIGQNGVIIVCKPLSCFTTELVCYIGIKPLNRSGTPALF